VTALEDAATAVEKAAAAIGEAIDRGVGLARAVRTFEYAVLHHAAEKAAAEMSGCCEECDAATSVMRNAIDPKGTS
jgi:uncharacterized protein (DUF924 family)